jgi:hypothetical protein
VSGSSVRRADVEAMVAAYRADLVAAGMFAAHPVTSVARTFFIRIGVDGWARLPLAQQCALPLKERRVVGWLIVTGRVRPSPDYLVACRPTSARSPPTTTGPSTPGSVRARPSSASTGS